MLSMKSSVIDGNGSYGPGAENSSSMLIVVYRVFEAVVNL
jgi:hypothetical protein